MKTVASSFLPSCTNRVTNWGRQNMTYHLARFAMTTVAWCAVSVAAHSADAPATNPTDASFQQEFIKQQQIKTTTRRVGEQLESVIAEFDRNGITGEDVKVLGAIRSVLDRLSEKDMATVLDYLQQSRVANDPALAAKTATEAYAGQKAIVVQLNQLVLEYQ